MINEIKADKAELNIYNNYRVFREQIELDPDVGYETAACDTLPEFILIKKERNKNA